VRRMEAKRLAEVSTVRHPVLLFIYRVVRLIFTLVHRSLWTDLPAWAASHISRRRVIILPRNIFWIFRLKLGLDFVTAAFGQGAESFNSR
jgi:hypothetical protein